MEAIARKRNFSAVKFLSLFLCLIMLFNIVPFGTSTYANPSIPLLYTNDSVFAAWEKTPPQKENGVVYLPLTMFVALDNLYYYSNPNTGSFYLQNEITNEYLSFSLKANGAYNGKTMLNIDIKVFNNTIYLPAIQTSDNLGLYVEMNSDKTIVRINDGSAKLSFSKLLELYTPVEKPPVQVPDPIPDNPDNPNGNDDPPVDEPPIDDKPVINPSDVYLCFTDPDPKNISSLMVALENENLDATFFLSGEYIANNPKSVMLIHAKGYSTALYIKQSHSDFEALYEDITSANELLERITKQKTRVLSFKPKYDNEIIKKLENKGYKLHDFNIVPSSYTTSKKLAEDVIAKINSSRTARVLLETNITSVSSIYEIGKYINSYSIVTSYAIDETV